MTVQDWLEQFAPSYRDLSEQEKPAIMDFSILWSFFETQVLNNNASARSIISRVRQWHSRGLLRQEEFSPFLEYFVERYVEDNALNYRFAHLNLRNNDEPGLVRRVLLASAGGQGLPTVDDIVAVLLIIVYRYRNNLFHGLKWAYNLQEQQGNFDTANQLLMKVLEITRIAT